ncbi:MAG: NAD(P)/FAD-dependent oxidoreductase [Acidimicrobiales bacterium]
MTEKRTYDVVVIGAGVSGIYQIKRLIDLGIDAIVLEGDDDLGGTWYRNRYPGARFDSESYTYGYSFSKELLDEWHWKERFSPQPENLAYLNYVADKFDLRPHMRFNSRVESMVWAEAERNWNIHLTTGETFTARFVVTSLGPLSMPTLPSYPGMDEFEGASFHTYWWPKEPVDLTDKRVGIIGTGATGIQVIAEIADKVGDLTVFQRRPNWSTPLNNGPITEAEMAEIRSRYDEIFENCSNSAAGFEHLARRGFWDHTAEERQAIWDELYDQPGFAFFAGNFADIFFDQAANDEVSAYVANRIREASRRS